MDESSLFDFGGDFAGNDDVAEDVTLDRHDHDSQASWEHVPDDGDALEGKSEVPKFMKALSKAKPEKPATQATDSGRDSTAFLVFDTTLKESRQSSLKLPWENESPFERSAPYKLKLPNVGRWEVLHEAKDTSTSSTNIPQTTSWHRKRLMAARFARSDDQLVDVVHRKARELILYCPEDSQLGDALMDKAGRLCTETELSGSISDALAGKSVGTLLKRLTDYHRFGAWCISTGACRPMNPTESSIYQYMTFLRDGGAAATSGKSFIKALWFVHVHFGFKSLDIVTALSGRIKGVASILATRKRPLTQAPVIPSDTLYALERLLDTLDNRRACVLGFLLFCLYRQPDFQMRLVAQNWSCCEKATLFSLRQKPWSTRRHLRIRRMPSSRSWLWAAGSMTSPGGQLG